MGSLVEVFPAMKGTILTVLALLVASCQMKPAKHFLIETKTNTDDGPAGKGEDYLNINQINGVVHGGIGSNHNSGIVGGNTGGNNINSGNSMGQSGGKNWNNQDQRNVHNTHSIRNQYPSYWGSYYGNCLEEGEIVDINFNMNWKK